MYNNINIIYLDFNMFMNFRFFHIFFFFKFTKKRRRHEEKIGLKSKGLSFLHKMLPNRGLKIYDNVTAKLEFLSVSLHDDMSSTH